MPLRACLCGVSLSVLSMCYVWSQSLQCCIQYFVVLHCVIMAPDYCVQRWLTTGTGLYLEWVIGGFPQLMLVASQIFSMLGADLSQIYRLWTSFVSKAPLPLTWAHLFHEVLGISSLKITIPDRTLLAYLCSTLQFQISAYRRVFILIFLLAYAHLIWV